ncbi:MAG: MBL fold metallo-hydrolase [FCB group bacterium]|nr:MBL fold metallo-hydrolase [FCB group bacterium]
MKRVIVFTITFIFVLCYTTLTAQDKPVFQTTQLTEHLHMLTTDQGAYTTNTIVSVGDDGILIVDTQTKSEAEELKKIIDGFDKGLPKYIINTHRHVEHIGGNAIFGDEPIKIAHVLYPEKLKSGSYIFEEFPEATYPDITLADSLTLNFNGEKIRIIALGGSHDDNEIIVHFTQSKVVHLSSLVNGFNFPSIDGDGNIFMFAPLVARAIKLLPEDVTIVSGHNPPGRWDQLQPYHDMLLQTVAAVKAGLDAGKDAAALKEEKTLDQWKEYAGSYVSVDDWVDYIIDGFESKDKPRKKSIYVPIYYAIKDGGADAGIAKYLELKNKYGDEYEFTEFGLLVIGDKFKDKQKYPEAIRYLELNLKEYPEGKYSYYCLYLMAEAQKDSGQKDKAIASCKKAIELKPDFQAGAKLLEELEKM